MLVGTRQLMYLKVVWIYIWTFWCTSSVAGRSHEVVSDVHQTRFEDLVLKIEVHHGVHGTSKWVSGYMLDVHHPDADVQIAHLRIWCLKSRYIPGHCRTGMYLKLYLKPPLNSRHTGMYLKLYLKTPT